MNYAAFIARILTMLPPAQRRQAEQAIANGDAGTIQQILLRAAPMLEAPFAAGIPAEACRFGYCNLPSMCRQANCCQVESIHQ